MPRKIEVELTSDRGDGTWTWRAAGAKQPKGDLPAELLHAGAKVGDVVRAEADFEVDGIIVTSVAPIKARERSEPERIEIIGPAERDERLVTTTLAPKGRGGGRRDRGDRPERGRGDRPGGDRGRGDRPRGDRPDGDPRRDRKGDRRRGERPGRDEHGGERRRERRGRPERSVPEAKPKPKRLRPARTHRNEALAALPEEHKPIAEHVLRGGVPAVRQAVEKQNAAHREAGQPEIDPTPIVALAEEVLPALRAAEWHDRAEAALATITEVDLRDLRSVVVAADDAARDATTRDLAEQLRSGLAQRVEDEHRAWLAELTELLDQGRVVRALRLSSRPPKAGTPLPPELSKRLAERASASLTAETGQDRFATVLDALAYSPVRSVVTAEAVPAEPNAELTTAVKKLGSRLPQIAAQFGIQSEEPRRRRGGGRGKGGRGPQPKPAERVPGPEPVEPATDAVGPTSAAGEPATSAAEPAAAPSEPAPVVQDLPSQAGPPSVEAPSVAEAAPAVDVPSEQAPAPEPPATDEPTAVPEPTATAEAESQPAAEPEPTASDESAAPPADEDAQAS